MGVSANTIQGLFDESALFNITDIFNNIFSNIEGIGSIGGFFGQFIPYIPDDLFLAMAFVVATLFNKKMLSFFI